MHKHLQDLTANFEFTETIAQDVPRFLAHHGYPKTAAHSKAVASKACEIAIHYDANSDHAQIAGWLHDVSAVFPAAERVDVANKLGVPVLPEEKRLPMIVHQKLSVVLAESVFGVTDSAILSAIGCHTTLKTDACLLDKVVFVADKIAWDQAGDPPYLEAIIKALDKSIDHAAFVYLDYLYQMRDKLVVWHPWTAAAHSQLKTQLGF